MKAIETYGEHDGATAAASRHLPLFHLPSFIIEIQS